MKCRLCEDKLLEYLYGELSEEDVAAMEKHLEESDACRQAYEGFASVLETVAGVEEEGLPGPLHTRIMGYAEEAGSKRRSLWAWLFRPAMTTAVIGAITAGVYFTAIRHKPPSYRDERILFEESVPGKSKERSSPPPSRTKADSLEKEEKTPAFQEKLVEEFTAVREGRAVPEPKEREQEALKKSAPLMMGSPYGREDPFKAADKMDEQVGHPLDRRRFEAMRGREEPAPSERIERKGHAPAKVMGPATAPSVSLEPDLATMKTTVPDLIARVLDLASGGHCAEAERRVEAFFAEHPKEEACGAGWLETARCFLKKGNAEAARKTAEKALEIPAYAKEAQVFLESLPASER